MRPVSQRITLEAVKIACRWFDIDASADQGDYKHASQFGWNEINRASEDDLMLEGGPIWFLDRWHAFSSYYLWPNKIDPNMPRMLKYAQSNAKEELEGLQGLSILNVDLSNREVTKRIWNRFYALASIGFRFRHVAASKCLHMQNPELFVMWDNKIATLGYGIGGFSDLIEDQNRAANEYVDHFLPAVQQKLTALLADVVAETRCEPKEAPQRLRGMVSDSHEVRKTCAKIIDEYNYYTYTRS
jgi:hypothetical protein